MRHLVVCQSCRVLPKVSCDVCLGRTIYWSDGVPMTVCPASAPGERKSCGRRLDRACSSCGRAWHECGDENDRKHTRAMVCADMVRGAKKGEA